METEYTCNHTGDNRENRPKKHKKRKRFNHNYAEPAAPYFSDDIINRKKASKHAYEEAIPGGEPVSHFFNNITKKKKRLKHPHKEAVLAADPDVPHLSNDISKKKKRSKHARVDIVSVSESEVLDLSNDISKKKKRLKHAHEEHLPVAELEALDISDDISKKKKRSKHLHGEAVSFAEPEAPHISNVISKKKKKSKHALENTLSVSESEVLDVSDVISKKKKRLKHAHEETVTDGEQEIPEISDHITKGEQERTKKKKKKKKSKEQESENPDLYQETEENSVQEKDKECINNSEIDASSSEENLHVGATSGISKANKFKGILTQEIRNKDSLKEAQSNQSKSQVKEELLTPPHISEFLKVCLEDGEALNFRFDGPPICPYCSKIFSRPSHRNHHVKAVHMHIKPYQCAVCDKSFSEKQTLKVHEYLHTDELNYECEICNRKFRNVSNYYAHQRTHWDIAQSSDMTSKDKKKKILKENGIFLAKNRLNSSLEQHKRGCESDTGTTPKAKRRKIDPKLIASAERKTEENFKNLDDSLNELDKVVVESLAEAYAQKLQGNL